MNETARSGKEKLILREDREGITTLTLNRPHEYNVFSQEMLDRMYVALRDIADDKTVRVVVIAGNGKGFCAGQDLKEMRANPSKTYHKVMYRNFAELVLALTRLPQPVIARIHGATNAAGCQLVAHCDLAVASSEARFGLGEVKLGLFGSTPGVVMSRCMPLKRVAEMLLTGDSISAEEACADGLITHVAAPDKLDDVIKGLASRIMTNSAAAVSAGKRVLYKQLDMDLGEAYRYAASNMATGMESHDAIEGIDAFIEKRAPEWQHR